MDFLLHSYVFIGAGVFVVFCIGVIIKEKCTKKKS